MELKTEYRKKKNQNFSLKKIEINEPPARLTTNSEDKIHKSLSGRRQGLTL